MIVPRRSSSGRPADDAARRQASDPRRERAQRALGAERSNGRWSGAGPSAADQDGRVDEEDHEGDGAHRRVAHRQGAAARRRGAAVQRADHRGHPQPGRRRRRAQPSAAQAARRRSAPSPTSSSPPTAASPVATTTTSSAPPSARCAPTVTPGATRSCSSSARRRTATSASAARPSRRRSSASPTSRPTSRRARSRMRSPPRSRTEEVDTVELVYTQFLSAGSQRVVVRRLMPLDTEQARRGRGGRRDRRLRVRARPRHHPRAPAAPLRRGPARSPRCSTRRRRSTRPASGP